MRTSDRIDRFLHNRKMQERQSLKVRVIVERIDPDTAEKLWEDPLKVWEWTVEDHEGSVTGAEAVKEWAIHEAKQNVPAGVPSSNISWEIS